MMIRAVIEWDTESQSYSATCPKLNFISSCGDTKHEAIINLQDAIKLILEPIPLSHNSPPNIDYEHHHRLT